MNNNENYYALKIQIGALETYILSDGVISLKSIQPVFAPSINEEILENQLIKLHSSIEKIEAGIHVLLIKKYDKKILLDTGCGYHFGESGGKLIFSLKAININPEDITDIVITHGHNDHIGGILDKENNIVFPNAVYHIAKKEYEFWMSDNPDFSNFKSGKLDITSKILFARNILDRIKSRLYTFDYGSELFSCLIPELAEGHTPGHTSFIIHSQGKALKHIVDTFHIPLLVSQPEWGSQWDIDFNKAVETRKRIIEEGIENKTLFMSCHLPWPGLGYIDKIGYEYYWQAYHYSNPQSVVL